MNTPEELKYSKAHQWIKIDNETGVVGITDYAQSQLTDIVFVDLPEVGKKITKNERIASVESVKSVSDVFCPVSGVITEINEQLLDNPELINNDCYNEGWIIKIKLTDPKEAESLLSSVDYTKETE